MANREGAVNEESKYRSRKFGLAIASFIVSSVGLFSGHLAGGEFVSLVGLILGLYGASNVGEKYVSGNHPA